MKVSGNWISSCSQMPHSAGNQSDARCLSACSLSRDYETEVSAACGHLDPGHFSGLFLPLACSSLNVLPFSGQKAAGTLSTCSSSEEQLSAPVPFSLDCPLSRTAGCLMRTRLLASWSYLTSDKESHGHPSNTSLLCTHVHKHVHACSCAYAVHVCIHVHVCLCVCYVPVSVWMHMYLCSYMRTLGCMCAYAETHTHTHKSTGMSYLLLSGYKLEDWEHALRDSVELLLGTPMSQIRVPGFESWLLCFGFSFLLQRHILGSSR